MNNRNRLAFALVFLLFGILVTVQIKSTKYNSQLQGAQGQRVQDVQAQLLREKEYSESLNNRIAEYEKQIGSMDVSDIVKKDLDRAKVLAGLTDVKGKGIIVTIDDTKSSSALKGISPNADNYIVRGLDILDLLNELRAAGAEAVSINDERIVSTSEVRNAGQYVRVNNKNMNRPYTIKAIGDPNTLEGSLKIREGIVETLTLSKVDVSIQRSDEVSIPKYNGIISTNYFN